MRDVYMLEMRNHAASDHHLDHNYNVMAEDVLRFAEKHQLNRFSVLGHSMGARCAMTLAAKNPDRIDGAISVDAAPVDEVGNTEKHFDFMRKFVS